MKRVKSVKEKKMFQMGLIQHHDFDKLKVQQAISFSIQSAILQEKTEINTKSKGTKSAFC